MKAMKMKFLIPGLLGLLPHLALALQGGETSGGGAQRWSLQGFEDATQAAIIHDAVSDAAAMVEQIDLEALPELQGLLGEIKAVKYILMPYNVDSPANRYPGDYKVSGQFIASTDFVSGAPTRIYPEALSIPTKSQWVQVIVHEAIHRTLPKPMNEYENLVVRLTNTITQYSPAKVAKAAKTMLAEASKRKVPWLVAFSGDCNKIQFMERMIDEQIVITGNGKPRVEIQCRDTGSYRNDGQFYVTVVDNLTGATYPKHWKYGVASNSDGFLWLDDPEESLGFYGAMKNHVVKSLARIKQSQDL